MAHKELTQWSGAAKGEIIYKKKKKRGSTNLST
jgi:hypothetical protein